MSLASRLAIVSDEAAESFAAAVSICLPLGVRAYELRSLPGGRVPFVDDSAIAEVEAQVAVHELTLIGISPGFGKCAVDDPAADVELNNGLDAAFRLLERLSVRRLTMFSYLRSGPATAIPDRVCERLRIAAARCRRHGVELLIENSPQCWGDTGEHLTEIARAVGCRVTWDPANAQAAGEVAYPVGYAAVRGQVAHVHCKNWRPGEGIVALAEGEVPMAQQVAALESDGYAGYYCVEPHQWRNRAAAARLNIEQLAGLLRCVLQGN